MPPICPDAARTQRRLYLIDRKYTTGLTADEEAELAELQADLARHLSAAAPLPFGELRRLEELVEAAAMDEDSAP